MAKVLRVLWANCQVSKEAKAATRQTTACRWMVAALQGVQRRKQLKGQHRGLLKLRLASHASAQLQRADAAEGAERRRAATLILAAYEGSRRYQRGCWGRSTARLVMWTWVASVRHRRQVQHRILALTTARLGRLARRRAFLAWKARASRLVHLERLARGLLGTGLELASAFRQWRDHIRLPRLHAAIHSTVTRNRAGRSFSSWLSRWREATAHKEAALTRCCRLLCRSGLRRSWRQLGDVLDGRQEAMKWRRAEAKAKAHYQKQLKAVQQAEKERAAQREQVDRLRAELDERRMMEPRMRRTLEQMQQSVEEERQAAAEKYDAVERTQEGAQGIHQRVQELLRVLQRDEDGEPLPSPRFGTAETDALEAATSQARGKLSRFEQARPAARLEVPRAQRVT